LLVALSACSSDAGAATTVPDPAGADQGTVPPPASTTTTLPDPAALLATALDQYAGGYEFNATVTVNGEEASTVAGRWVDGASELTVTSGEGEVDYVIAAGGQWARLPDGEWEALEGAPTTASPLLALAGPSSFDRAEPAGDAIVVYAVYPATALGLEGEPVAVRLVFTDGILVEAGYETLIEENAAVTVTTFRPVGDTTPITAPTT
jgi:hypothetical protein